jgi:hypothetical protein
MMEWQLIDTAPKDKTIFAYGTAWGDYGYTPDMKIIYPVRWNGKGWQVQSATPRYFNGFTPTHWYPIPEPPEKEK